MIDNDKIVLIGDFILQKIHKKINWNENTYIFRFRPKINKLYCKKSVGPNLEHCGTPYFAVNSNDLKLIVTSEKVLIS